MCPCGSGRSFQAMLP
ncbi:SEC-C metal-binding domain-containing protein [Leptolyngbya sp. FACHB-16]